MNRLVAFILSLAVLAAACAGDGPEAAGESVPRVEQTGDSTYTGD
ncbi:MAG: hypothetical protein R6V62_03020 [Candidatus Fermentibacteraceae bacterium]